MTATPLGNAEPSAEKRSPAKQYVPRSKVVQRLLSLFDEPSYLEVGVSRGVTFHAVKARRKVAVDPVFDFDWQTEQEKRRDTTTYHQVTSDEYFGSVIGEGERFDVIFLDGLHTFEQTLRDLLNALDHLSEGGIIVIDDVRPSSYHASLPDHLQSVRVRQWVKGDNKDWMGDVYRLLWFIDTFCQQLTYRTVSNNHGVAVVWRQRRSSVVERSVRTTAELSFEDFVLQQDVLSLAPFGKIFREIRALREPAGIEATG
ncbi:class I SAM-dependent methyltransferase [Nocardioides sp. cx-169]|uniref:class I SAM-dependent methyltransferase n=1 Tax=Nocardioides sp. cx-169 TaxID=2899080 RepID=UPI001E5A6F4F|nr:class I SAM-dependent methyltransferase [Nocardioides sp. cx-169]MCD4535999.1 class I SAM-dependent methyltransferase [Nocardioides sp. cx-169]